MTLAELAQALGLEFEGDGALEIRGVSGLDGAQSADLSFVTGANYANAYRASRAGACVVPPDFETDGRPCLRSLQPYVDFGRVIDLFDPPARPEPGIHPTAVVDPTAKLAADVTVGPLTVVGANTVIGARTVLHAHVTVYPDVVIGEDCELHAGVHVRERVRLGDRVILQNGAVIGAEGFGFAFGLDGKRVRIPHRSGVQIGDGSQIDANATIDGSHPGHVKEPGQAGTVIGNDVMIDCSVQIGHGCVLEDGVAISAMAAIGGSTEIGKGAYISGGSTTAGHLRIGEGTMLGGMTGVHNDLPANVQMVGIPAMDRRLFGRVAAAMKRLPDLLQRVRRIEKLLKVDPKSD